MEGNRGGGAMRASALSGVAAAVTALALVLSGCGSDTKTATESSTKSESSSSSSEKSSSSATSKKPTVTQTSEAAAAAGPNPTIATFIAENGIQETGVAIGDPVAPPVNLPVPPGWEVVSAEDQPEWSYGAIVNTEPEWTADQPNVIAIMSKLTGNVTGDQILELAPGELLNLPDYDGGDGAASSLAEFPAVVLGGTYTRDGETRFIAQKTVTIPAQDGLYVLQLNVDGPEGARDVLNAVTDAIDSETTIG